MTQMLIKNEGLTNVEADSRLLKYGSNTLPEKPPTPLWRRLFKQFHSPLIYILLFALVADFLIWINEGAKGLPVESIAIAIILLMNAGLGVFQEGKSEAALAKLKELSTPMVWVMREGRLIHLSSVKIVPGDIVRIEAGDRIPADGLLIESDGVLVDESVLTGESIPIDKEVGKEVLSGTLLVRGKAHVEVSRIGKESSMGKLATMLSTIEAEKTPLERKLDKFGKQIAQVVLLLTVLIAIGGIMIDGVERIGHILLFSIALAVAAIPEGLPAVMTLTLSLGVERMAKRKAIVRKLSAVEALGSVTVIATDKTGTLTENRMFVKHIDTHDIDAVMQTMVLANDAEQEVGAGDPLELALLNYASANGIDIKLLRQKYTHYDYTPFDSSYKFMSVTVEDSGNLVTYIKGAPEALLQRSLLTHQQRSDWKNKVVRYASEGYRILAFGRCYGDSKSEIEFLGLALLWDPPRQEVSSAIRTAQNAGIRVVMITGDHPATALAVANEIGIQSNNVLTGLDLDTMDSDALCEAIKETNVFARVVPEDKLRLVEMLKRNGEIVAMTGDGVNDAPALKRSDVGIAMGERGSDVSREVADLVLLDDNFATIVAAIEEGRNIYENIVKLFRFLFSTNLAEVMIVVGGTLGAALMGLHDETGAILLPLTAVQLLWVNLITDGPPALAFGLEKDSGVMKQSPRDPQLPLLDRKSLKFIIASGCFKAVIGGVMLLIMPIMGLTVLQTRTAIFLHASIGQLFYAYPARRINTPPQFNAALHIAVILGIGIQFVTVLNPWLRTMLGLEALTPILLLYVVIAVLISFAAAEIYSRIEMRRYLSA